MTVFKSASQVDPSHKKASFRRRIRSVEIVNTSVSNAGSLEQPTNCMVKGFLSLNSDAKSLKHDALPKVIGPRAIGSPLVKKWLPPEGSWWLDLFIGCGDWPIRFECSIWFVL